MTRPISLFALLGFGLIGCDTDPQNNTLTEDPEGDVLEAQERSAEFLAQETSAIFVPKRTKIDDLDISHTRFEQLHLGVRVFEGEAIVHLHMDGTLRTVTNAMIEDLVVDTQPLYAENEAVDIAVADIGGARHLTATPEVELVVLRRDQDHLVWKVQLERLDGTADTARPVIFVDAHTGKVVWQYDNLQTASGESNYSGTVPVETTPAADTFYLEDGIAGLGTYSYGNSYDTVDYLTDSDNDWTADSAREGVDAHYAGAGTLDYYMSTFGRHGIDGSGGPGYIESIIGSRAVISSFVNYGENYVNAFWTGTFMVFGDGDGDTYGPLTTIDVTAHEMTHGVVQHEANLTYAGESGAMNESYADVFGAMVERHMEGEDSDNWQIGEDFYTPSIPGDGALRYMSDPSRDGASSDHYSTRYRGSQDNGGVHWNSGIGNLAFYLLSEGGNHPSTGDGMEGIGAEAAAEIWYRGLTSYLTASSDFADTRVAHLNAAEDLYGSDSFEYAAVQDAWSLVGVGEPASEEEEPEESEEEETPESDPCEGFGTAYSGTLEGAGDSVQEPDGEVIRLTSSGLQEGLLVGPEDADFNLVLFRFIRGTGWRPIASSTDADSEEFISHPSRPGVYTWLVVSRSGGGDYTFCLNTP